MNELNEIQDIWKSGLNMNRNLHRQTEKVPETMIEKLKKLESLQNRVNMIKIVVMLAAFGLIAYSLSNLSHITWHVYVGFGIILLASVCFMGIYFKNQFAIKKLDFTADSLTFSENAVHMLQKQNSIFNVPFRIFVLVLVLGANVMISGMDTGSYDSFMVHIKITFLIAVSALLGLQVRKWRIRKEVEPLIAALGEINENGDE
jgi:hypothetical protein